MPRSPNSAEDSSKARQTPYVLGLIFVILAAGIVTAGYLYHRDYKQHYRAGVEHQLSAIAELKAHELADWRKERLGDAAVFFKNAAFSALVRRYFDNPADAEARTHLQAWLGLVQAHLLYDRVFLLDTQGVERISAPDASEPACPHLAQDVSETLRLGRVNFLDFHRHAPNGPIRLAVLVPISDDRDGNRPLGALVLRIDPATHLYPHISRWPTPSRTAETLIVRRDGNDALFLNDLRFRKDAALNLRVSLEEGKDLPAVKAAMGQEGIVEGTDYRGVPVIAAVRAVPDSPWFLVARMDAAEVYAPLRERLWAMVVVVGVLLLAAGAGLGLVWRQQSVRFYRERLEAAEALKESKERLELALSAASMGTWRWNIKTDQDTRDANFNSMLGLKAAESTQSAKDFIQHVHPDDRAVVDEEIKRAIRERDIYRIEFRIVRPDGTIYWLSDRGKIYYDQKNELAYMTGAVFNITDRKRAEEALRESEEKYRILVEQVPGLIHVAAADEIGSTKYVSPQIQSMLGFSQDEWLADPELWRKQLHPEDRERVLAEVCQTGAAGRNSVSEYRIMARDGRTVWVRDETRVWRDEHDQNQLQGIMIDITERKRMESERRFRELAESLPQLVWTCRADGPCDYLSPQWVEYTGIPEAEQLGSGWLEQLHPDDRDRTVSAWNAAVGSESFLDVEFRIRRKDGIYRWFKTRAVAIHDGQGRVVKWFGTNTDIDDQKRAEEALEGAKQKAEAARWRAESIGAVTAEVSRHMKPREIAEVVVRHLSGALHTPRCSMMLRTDDADGVEVVALYRDGKPAPFGHKGPMTLAEHPHITEAMRERQTVVVRSQERHELALRGQTAVDKPWYYIMVPIATGEDVFGTVNIAVVDPQTIYDDQDLLMVETMCRHAAQALKNAAMVDDLEHAHAEMEKANTRLEELATTDELTGLANRRGFMAAIGLETERARRYGSDFALAMIDVDGFKAINDGCGHVFGDRVLVEIARALEEGVRANDLVARYGGDEIIILMPNTNVGAAVDAVERLRKKVSARPIADNTRALEVSFGAGISALDSKDRTAGPDLLIRQADEALYAAKHAGGNVTKTWNEITEDRTGEIADEAAGVEDLRREVAGLSLQAKEMVVQSLGGLVHALEARDAYTKAHSANVTRYAVAIAETLKLGPEVIGVVRRAAMIHDIGKIAVPDSILRKRGALDDHERRIMQGHVLAGVRIIDQMHFLERETPIIRHHHERWEGGGYPDGIAGEAIPLGARILAVADAFDAITSNRVYRNARSVSDALQILIEESGRQFNPGVVDALLKWALKTGRELGKESDLTVADLLQSQPVPVPA